MRREFVFTAILALSACDRVTQPAVEVSHARSPATPPGATVGAVYAELTARRDDMLLRAETPIAERVEIHATSHESGMMQMRPAATVELPAGASVEFAPGALHFMLIGLRGPLAPQSKFPMTFHFQNAGDVSIEVPVVAPGELQH